jgi:hypothetical protein
VESVYSRAVKEGVGMATEGNRKTNAAQAKIMRGCDDAAQLTVGEAIPFKPGVQHCSCLITGNTETFSEHRANAVSLIREIGFSKRCPISGGPSPDVGSFAQSANRI